MTKVQKAKKQSKILASFHDDEEKKLSDISTLLDDLFHFRLIQKISRPITNRKRESLIDQYKKKFQLLHEKMEQVKTDSFKESETHSATKEKSGKSTRATKPLNWKNQIKNITSKYNEILVEGSFKHYERVCKFHQIHIFMKVIDCNGWYEATLMNSGKEPESCC